MADQTTAVLPAPPGWAMVTTITDGPRVDHLDPVPLVALIVTVDKGRASYDVLAADGSQFDGSNAVLMPDGQLVDVAGDTFSSLAMYLESVRRAECAPAVRLASPTPRKIRAVR